MNKSKVKYDYDVFISYSHNDRDKIQPFLDSLIHRYLLKLWIDKECIRAGDDWRQKIVEGVRASKLTICFISQSYLKSSTCRLEIKLAADAYDRRIEDAKKSIDKNHPEYDEEIRKIKDSIATNYFLVLLEDNIDVDNVTDIASRITGLHHILIYKNVVKNNDVNKDKSVVDFSNLWSGQIYRDLLEAICSRTGVGIPYVKKLDLKDLNIKKWLELEKISDGTFAEVKKTSFNGKCVSVKKYLQDSCERYKNEIEILGNIRNENIVQLMGYYDGIFEDDNGRRFFTYIVLEYMNCGNLLRNLSLLNDFNTKKDVIMFILRGLNYLHESAKVFHGDICCRTILLHDIGEKRIIAKLTDFEYSQCISRKLEIERKSYDERHGSQSVRWLPPEYFENKLTVKSDIWSFGLLMRAILVGREEPFDTLEYNKVKIMLQSTSNIDLNLESLIVEKSKDLKDIISKCVTRNANERLSTRQLIEGFNHIF